MLAFADRPGPLHQPVSGPRWRRSTAGAARPALLGRAVPLLSTPRIPSCCRSYVSAREFASAGRCGATDSRASTRYCFGPGGGLGRRDRSAPNRSHRHLPPGRRRVAVPPVRRAVHLGGPPGFTPLEEDWVRADPFRSVDRSWCCGWPNSRHDPPAAAASTLEHLVPGWILRAGTADIREVFAGYGRRRARPRLALDDLVHRLRSGSRPWSAAMGAWTFGVLFTGGVGETHGSCCRRLRAGSASTRDPPGRGRNAGPVARTARSRRTEIGRPTPWSGSFVAPPLESSR